MSTDRLAVIGRFFPQAVNIAVVALLVGACGASPAAPAATPYVPEVTPTPPPWAISVSSMKYSTTARVGGELFVTAVVENTGTAANPSLEFQFSDIDDYADIVGCVPKCEVSEGLGDTYAAFPGIAAGKEKTYIIEFIPTKVGAARWSVCVFDDASFGDLVYCGDATTVIR